MKKQTGPEEQTTGRTPAARTAFETLAPAQSGSPPSLLRHQQKVLSNAERRFGSPASPIGAANAKDLRAFLRLEDERLRVADRLGAGGLWIAHARTFTVDLLVQTVFQQALGERSERESGIALVALGGYGRAELAPFSDIDLLFLSADRPDAGAAATIERCQHLLWDAGLSLSQKSCTISSFTPSARSDPHFQTALVSARAVGGDRSLHDQLISALSREREKHGRMLLEIVQHEHDHRYQKRGAAIYLQEPNVKESAGGLRDLHCAIWAAYARTGVSSLAELFQLGLIDKEQHQRAVTSYDFLLRVRLHAHWATGRKTDHLALDLQDSVARKMGYTATGHLQASEAFMRDYYRNARDLHQFSESLFAQSVERRDADRKWFATPRRKRLNELFSLRDRRLHFEGDARRFAEDPLLAFQAVTLAQTNDAVLSRALHDAIRNNLNSIDRDFRSSNEAAQAFISLLRRRGDVGRTLRLMHEAGLLGRFLPEFERVSMLIQHDLYHHYTVDEHTLRAIETLDALHRSHEPGLARLRSVLDELEDPGLLYLGLLLHDLGKTGGRGHIVRGVRIAEGICDRLGLDAKSKRQVLLLVRHHVLMAQVSQRRDLREPRLAKEFARQVGEVEVLDMLFLLTYADLNGVGPAVWSDWKGTLLKELYTLTRANLTGESTPADDGAARDQSKARVIELLAWKIPISAIERHFALSSSRYTETVSAEEVELHLDLISKIENDLIGVRWQDREDFATELTLCTRDRRGLFADIAGALAACGIEILRADINTREDGVVVDSFILRQATTHRSIDVHRWPNIERSLSAVIKGEHDVAALVERWRTRHAPRSSLVATKRTGRMNVLCDNEIAEATTLVEVRAPDEHGLAYRIARALAAFGLDIVSARIATEKSDALDVFYVKTTEGLKLDEAGMKDLKDALMSVLANDAARVAPADLLKAETLTAP